MAGDGPLTEEDKEKGRRALAGALAGRCRALREGVLAALAAPSSGLRAIADRWRARADTDEARFADAFAQIVTYALWMDRVAGEGAVAQAGTLVAEALAAVASHEAEIEGPLAALRVAIAAVERRTPRAGEDAWLYFYEEFLAAYDGRLRQDAGTYYTPVEVVRAQVAIVGEVLERELGLTLGFAAPGVRTIDPSCGTGVYPCAIVEHAAHGEATAGLAGNLEARELHVAPWAVAELRIARALAGAGLPATNVRVQRGDTLARPGAREDRWWAEARVRVCIGNPPYDRQELGEDRGGGWVRFGDPARGEAPIFADFSPPRSAGRHAKNLYNQYVYFWRWALWHVFERSQAPGIVCFITGSSYLGGPGFSAMRRHMREVLDALWIIDLEGDPLGPRRSANVFLNVRTPVCIAIGLRRSSGDRGRPAEVWYTLLKEDGHDRGRKLEILDGVRALADLAWTRGPEEWEAPFIPGREGRCEHWPRLADLFPWQHSGAQWKRTWPVAETQELLDRRWRALLAAEDRRAAFRETEAWTIAREGVDLMDGVTRSPAIASLPADAPAPRACRIAWRALDRRWCLADARLGDRLRPALWQCHGPAQIYLTTLMSTGLASGPAAIACREVPDLHHFRGSYGDKGVVPLWRDPAATEPNVCPGLLEILTARLGFEVTPELLFGYVYGCLAAPGDVGSAEPGPRVPVSADPELFRRCAAVGTELLGVHTFSNHGDLGTRGAARCVVAVPMNEYPQGFAYAEGELRVGAGVFAPVSPEVWSYAVSGYKIVRSWLAARMPGRPGRMSSPLDKLRPEVWTEALTGELLEVLWALERSLELHGEQLVILKEIVAGPLIDRGALPQPTAASRRAPRARGGSRGA